MSTFLTKQWASREKEIFGFEPRGHRGQVLKGLKDSSNAYITLLCNKIIQQWWCGNKEPEEMH